MLPPKPVRVLYGLVGGFVDQSLGCRSGLLLLHVYGEKNIGKILDNPEFLTILIGTNHSKWTFFRGLLRDLVEQQFFFTVSAQDKGKGFCVFCEKAIRKILAHSKSLSSQQVNQVQEIQDGINLLCSKSPAVKLDKIAYLYIPIWPTSQRFL